MAAQSISNNHGCPIRVAESEGEAECDSIRVLFFSYLEV